MDPNTGLDAFAAMTDPEGASAVSGVPEFMGAIRSFLANRGDALSQQWADTKRVGSTVGNYLANVPANFIDFAGNQVAAPFMQSQYDLMNRDYSREPLVGVGKESNLSDLGVPSQEGGELTGRIPALAGMVSPYLAGGAPGGSLGAGARVPDLWHGAARPWPAEPGAPLGRFQPMKLMSGEGYHGEGYGGYVSEARPVAEWYREAYAKHPPEVEDEARRVFMEKYPIGSKVPGSLHDKFNAPSDYKEFINDNGYYLSDNGKWTQLAEDFANFNPPKPGALYNLKYPNADIEQFLRWDQPLNQQSDYVKAALRRLGIDENASLPKGGQYYGGEVPYYVTGPGQRPTFGDLAGRDLYEDVIRSRYGTPSGELQTNPGGDPRTASVLRMLGIRGTRYPADERNVNAFNYSIFSPEATEVIKRFGIAGLLGGSGAAALSQPEPGL